MVPPSATERAAGAASSVEYRHVASARNADVRSVTASAHVQNLVLRRNRESHAIREEDGPCGSQGKGRRFQPSPHGKRRAMSKTTFPLPGSAVPVVAVPAPGAGPGYWAGASSAVIDRDGTFVVAYRVRNGHDGIDQTVVARSPDGEVLTTVATLDQSRFGAQWMERPALVRTERGRWRMYVCCGAPASKRWRIDVLEADDPAGLATADARA